MTELAPNLYVGTIKDYRRLSYDDDWAIVSFTKSVPHSGKDTHLAVNVVDANHFKYFSIEMFEKAINFIRAHIGDKKVLVHCDKAESRSPSLCMIYMALAGRLPKRDHIVARNVFELLYEPYVPNTGINTFLSLEWNKLLKIKLK